MTTYDPPTDVIQADLDRIRQLTGEDRISLRKANWSTLMKQGVIATVTIGRWRGRTRLDPEDLGLPADAILEQDLSDLLHLGDKILLPAQTLRALEAVESRARKVLIRSGFRTFWGAFVPVTSYREFRQEMDGCRTAYFALRDEIVRDYDEIHARMHAAYRAAGVVAHSRLKALLPDQYIDDSPTFAETFADRILANVPPVNEISASFRFQVSLSYIPLPSLLAENEVADPMATESYPMSNGASNGNGAPAMDRTSALQRARALQEMNRDIVDKARQQKDQLVDGFLSDVQSQLNRLVHDACTDVLAALQGNGKLNSRNVVRMKRLVESVSKLNFYGDAEVETAIQRVQEQITLRTPDERSLLSIEETLKSIATVTRQTLVDLGERPHSARDLGVPDEPSDTQVRMARRQLRIEDASNDDLLANLPIFDRPRLQPTDQRSIP